MEYIVFMHKNENSGPPGGAEEEWDHFLRLPKKVASSKVAAPSLNEQPSAAVT